jgi:hypothetical protein
VDENGSKNKEFRGVPGSHYFEDSKESLENVSSLIAQWTTKTLSEENIYDSTHVGVLAGLM